MTTSAGERLADWIARHPASPIGRLAALRIGLPRRTDLREIATAPPTLTRVLIAPANYAGQATQWARALEQAVAHLGARSLAVESAFGFPADARVSRRVFQNSPRWQRAQSTAAEGFSHLLVESLIPPFGRLARRDLRRQLARLGTGISVAFVCHGTDVRSAGRPHEELTSAERQADRIARRNRSLLAQLSGPVFVTTPDLLDDVPDATWLPVVIDVERWRAHARTVVPGMRVVHIPSSSALKGTAMVDPVAQLLHAEGVIDYRTASGVRHDRMPGELSRADVVLDQFVLGSYGVAACEAMAAGCVVVGHVTPVVRDRVRAATGRDLPIVEATPATLSSVLRRLAADPAERARIAEAGSAFTGAVHDGRLSADILAHTWISPDSPRSAA
ncbi:hypothetical protein KZC51_09270 [Microbacterium sp. SSW1-49]|uniref:Glycosyltransferase n=1 Tax=Microbacterium croceum TaxID=2851645 RepID=A0ABT0FE32_9MICO|nr:glycosyltransferase [Microbacterium croceum]MCK2036327.1 hypothetical protein [Microbacterium croceum]